MLIHRVQKKLSCISITTGLLYTFKALGIPFVFLQGGVVYFDDSLFCVSCVLDLSSLRSILEHHLTAFRASTAAPTASFLGKAFIRGAPSVNDIIGDMPYLLDDIPCDAVNHIEITP